MDELWQRYRTFWTPVLIGLGVFLVGVIAVHVMTDDPEELAGRLATAKRKLSKKQMPSRAHIRTQTAHAEAMGANVSNWAQRLDQTDADAGDLIELGVDQALRASLLRGATAREARAPSALAKRFDGDTAAAEIALRQFEKARQDRIELLRTADPNVGFSRLLIEVWNEMRQRANRADVDLRTTADRLGFAGVSSVDAGSLPQRVLNLALLARIANAGIEAGIESIDAIRVSRPAGSRSDAFLNEWSVEIAVTGQTAAVKEVLALLTDPQDPVALGDTTLKLPRSAKGLSGRVTLETKAYSVRVNPGAVVTMGEEDDA